MNTSFQRHSSRLRDPATRSLWVSRTFASIFGLTAALALQAQTTVDPGEKISLATGSTAPLAVTTLPTATYRGPGGGVAVIYNNVALTSVDPNNPGAPQTSGVPGAGGPYPALVPVFRPIVALQGWTPRGEALTGVVKDQTALVQLGKLLFWDTQAGSDGQSCASCHFLAEIADAVGNGIAVIARICERLFDLLHNLLIRWICRIAHAKVNHIHAGNTQLILSLIDRPEQIRRQTTNSIRHGNGKRVIFEQNF